MSETMHGEMGDLIDLAYAAKVRALHERSSEVVAILAAVLPEHERQVRDKVSAEIAEPSTWADPTGRWTADQADAARAMKEHIVRRIARGGA